MNPDGYLIRKIDDKLNNGSGATNRNWEIFKALSDTDNTGDPAAWLTVMICAGKLVPVTDIVSVL